MQNELILMRLLSVRISPQLPAVEPLNKQTDMKGCELPPAPRRAGGRCVETN